MSRSSARGQVEPLAALAAVAVVGLALAGYAGVLSTAIPPSGERSLADPALRRALDAPELRAGAAVNPYRLAAVHPDVAPDGYRANLTVRTTNRTWTAGPAPPTVADRDAASRAVPVRTGPATIRSGRLRVVVWR